MDREERMYKSYNARKKREQEKIDKILDKINSSGYDSLSDEDKRTLSNNH